MLIAFLQRTSSLKVLNHSFPTFEETSTSKEILLYITTNCRAHVGRLFFSAVSSLRGAGRRGNLTGKQPVAECSKHRFNG